jgi:G3E family GTPase
MRVSATVPEASRLPLTIISGEPGAGKTTLLGQLVRQEHDEGLAVILDALEPLHLDARVVARTAGPYTELTNGTRCYALAGELSAELAELRTILAPATHVVLEARGTESLRRIAGYGYMPGYRPDGIIIVMEARALHEGLQDDVKRSQLSSALHAADILIINKVDELEREHRAAPRRWLDDAFPTLRVLETCHGQVAGSLLLGVSPAAARRDARAVPGNWDPVTYHASSRQRQPRASESAEPRCRLWRIETETSIAAQRFRNWVALLPHTVIRGTGNVLIQEDPGHRYHFHMIGHRWQLQRGEPWGHVAPETQLSLVGL